MATKLDSWNRLVEENWKHWEYYKSLYTYATQMPANTFFTRKLYPVWYQTRLLKKQLSENMQILGQVANTEITQYETLTEEHIKKAFNYHTRTKTLSGFYSTMGLLGGVLLSAFAWAASQPNSWRVVPGLVFYCLQVGVSRRTFDMRLGQVLDMTEWVKEKRKAEVWLEENSKNYFGMPSLPLAKEQVIQEINKAASKT